MKAILEFDLNEPEEREAHKRAAKVDDLYVAIYQFDQMLRSKIKYGELPDQVYEAYVNIREQLHNKLAEHEWNLD